MTVDKTIIQSHLIVYLIQFYLFLFSSFYIKVSKSHPQREDISNLYNNLPVS